MVEEEEADLRMGCDGARVSSRVSLCKSWERLDDREGGAGCWKSELRRTARSVARLPRDGLARGDLLGDWPTGEFSTASRTGSKAGIAIVLQTSYSPTNSHSFAYVTYLLPSHLSKSSVEPCTSRQQMHKTHTFPYLPPGTQPWPGCCPVSAPRTGCTWTFPCPTNSPSATAAHHSHTTLP